MYKGLSKTYLILTFLFSTLITKTMSIFQKDDSHLKTKTEILMVTKLLILLSTGVSILVCTNQVKATILFPLLPSLYLSLVYTL
jgi:hypothetical protein